MYSTLCSQILHLSVVNYRHALLLVLLFISCATIPSLYITAMLLLYVQIMFLFSVFLILKKDLLKCVGFEGRSWMQVHFVVSGAPLLLCTLAHAHLISCYLFFGTTELCNMVMYTLAYFLFLDIQHCPSGLNISLLFCGFGIHVNYNKWKFLGILQDILCFFSRTNL